MEIFGGFRGFGLSLVYWFCRFSFSRGLVFKISFRRSWGRGIVGAVLCFFDRGLEFLKVSMGFILSIFSVFRVLSFGFGVFRLSIAGCRGWKGECRFRSL